MGRENSRVREMEKDKRREKQSSDGLYKTPSSTWPGVTNTAESYICMSFVDWETRCLKRMIFKQTQVVSERHCFKRWRNTESTHFHFFQSQSSQQWKHFHMNPLIHRCFHASFKFFECVHHTAGCGSDGTVETNVEIGFRSQKKWIWNSAFLISKPYFSDP